MPRSSKALRLVIQKMGMPRPPRFLSQPKPVMISELRTMQELAAQGLSHTEIGKRIGRPHGTVAYHLREH